jgi:hypothetical protein
MRLEVVLALERLFQSNMVVDLSVDREHDGLVVADQRLSTGVCSVSSSFGADRVRGEPTNTDNGQTLVHQHSVLGHVASRPVRTTVALEFRKSDGFRPERCQVALTVVAAEDTAHC